MTDENDMLQKQFVVAQLTGFILNFDNKWSVDCAFGAGTLSDNKRGFHMRNTPEVYGSNTCETIILDSDGNDQTEIVGRELNLHVSGFGECAVLDYLKFADWLRVINHVAAKPGCKNDTP